MRAQPHREGKYGVREERKSIDLQSCEGMKVQDEAGGPYKDLEPSVLGVRSWPYESIVCSSSV